MIISYSYGHHVPELGGGVFGFSHIFTCKSFKEFADELRHPIAIRGLMDYAEQQYVPRSSMTVLVNIDNNHYFRIRMKNVREYKKAVDDYINFKKSI